MCQMNQSATAGVRTLKSSGIKLCKVGCRLMQKPQSMVPIPLLTGCGFRGPWFTFLIFFVFLEQSAPASIQLFFFTLENPARNYCP